MRHALTIAAVLLAVALTGGLWLTASALVPRWGDGTGLQIQTPAKIEVPLGASTSMELLGEGMTEGTRAWLVPETTQRQAQAGSFKTWGNPYRLRKSGDRVYLANARSGVLALDLSDWSQPTLLGGMKLPGQAFDLELLDSRLFVACGSAGLQIVDFTDPAAPQLLAALPLPGPAMALQLQGDRLYIAAAKAGLLVVDVANPANPFLLAQAATPGPALDVTLAAKSVFLACARSGVARFDITTPGNPRPLATIHPSGTVRSLEGNGTILYVGSVDKISSGVGNLLSSYDCRDPNHPRLLSERPLSGDPLTMQIHQQQLIIAQTTNGVSIFDLADPEQPQLHDTIVSPGSARSAIVEGDWLIIADGTGYLLTTRRDRQLQLPVMSKIARRGGGVPLLQNGLLFVPQLNSSLQIYAVNDPRRPVLLTALPILGEVTNMALRDDLLVIAAGVNGTAADSLGGRVFLVSLIDPAHPRILSSLDFPGAPVGLALDGNRLVVSAPGQPFGRKTLPPGTPRGHLIVVDLSELRQPAIRHDLTLAQTPVAMAWQDGHAFIAMEEGDMQIVQVPTERPPTMAGGVKFNWLQQAQLSENGASRGGVRGGIELIGGVAAVHSGVSELSFVDVAVPSRPVTLGTCETPGFIGHMESDGNLLYVGVNNRGIAIYDMTLPWQPRQIGLLPMPWATRYFSFSEDALWYISAVSPGVTSIPRPQPIEISVDAEGRKMALKLPPPPAIGDYTLWVERNNVSQEVPNSVHFSAR